MTVISYALWMLTNLFAFVAIGAVAMTARFVGAGDWPAANRVVDQSFLLGGDPGRCASRPAACCGAITWPGLLQLEGEPAALATRYLRILMPMLPMMMLEAVGIGCLRGAGDMVDGAGHDDHGQRDQRHASPGRCCWASARCRQMGWDALPIGTACGHAVGGLIPLCVLLARPRRLAASRAACCGPTCRLMRRILRIGLPGGIDVLSIVGCQLIFISIVNRLSTDEVAAHGVAIRIESLAYLPGYAFQVAAATLAGQYLGARDYRAGRPQRAGGLPGQRHALDRRRAGAVLRRRPLVDLFLSAEQTGVAAIAPTLLRIVSIAMPPLALVQVLTGALRGAGDTRWPLAFTFIGFVGVRLPLAYLLAIAWGWGIQGAWYAMVADVLVRCALVSYRFRHGGWKRTEVLAAGRNGHASTAAPQ